MEERVRAAISPDRIQQGLEVFSNLFRDSGTEDEWKAARYLVSELEQRGIQAEILELPSLISLPGEGRLATLDADGTETETFAVRTRSFGQQTSPGGLEAELVFVPFQAPKQGEMIFSHRAVAGDYSGLDVRGKIVLTVDGGPDGVLRAQEHGAAGHIHIWPSDEPLVHEMICTSIWGTPTPDSAARLPQIPVLGIGNADGLRLAEQITQGPVRVRLESNVATAWTTLPLATGYIPGALSDDYLLVGAHIDSWYEGVTDNATGDIALLEMATVLAPEQANLRRGVRFCWWPGHSTGRYSGSTWFADEYFDELREHALGYLNIDSPGVRDTAIWDCRYNMGEIEDITASVVRELSGQEPNIRRPLRAGDQSFWGVGLPSLGAFRMLPVDHPERKAVGGSGGGYWWHTPEDTLDKADATILAKDVEVYVTITLRMVNPEVIPYNFVASAQDFIDQLTALQEDGGDHLDLRPVIERAEAYRAAAEKLAQTTPVDLDRHNAGLKRLSRIVNPALFTASGPYEVDPALQMSSLPGLTPVRQLARLEPGTNEYGFLRTKLVRQRNRVHDALVQAVDLAESLA